MRIYIGYDSREHDAYTVACCTMVKNASGPVSVVPLELERLHRQGLVRRPLKKDGARTLDVISGAPQSTEFAASRFLVPFLAQTGWALFVDCDVVALADPRELLDLADQRYAVMCVKHDAGLQAGSGIKMDGQAQVPYPRKNWSSCVLWNCDHPAHERLTIDVVNGARGKDLHAFFWLDDDEVGELPAGWNWLVNVAPKPAEPKIAHFTQGGPWLPNWPGAEHDEIWTGAAADAGVLRKIA